MNQPVRNIQTKPISIAALLVGVRGNGDLALANTSNDLDAMKKCLNMGASLSYLEVLEDPEATTSAVNAAFGRLREQQASLVVFYFTGHGRKTGVDSFLCTSDSTPGNEGIPLSMLVRQMPRGADHPAWLAILDCCHSTPTNVHSEGIAPRDLDESFTGYGSNRAVLAACEPQSETLELGDNESPFTRAIVDGLTGAATNAKGEVTLGSLHDYVSATLLDRSIPEPVLVGDLSSSLALVNGFLPRGTAPLGTDSKATLLRDAERFSAHLRGQMAMPEEMWIKSGWIEACRHLKPVVRWFERVESYPELAKESRFVSAKAVVDRHLAYVASVEKDIRTKWGVLGSRLGQGGFGTVWTAHDGESGKDFAVKFYHGDELYDKDKRRRFERGFRAMEQLDHKRIVKVFEYADVPPVIVMDLVPGNDLRQSIFGLTVSERLALIRTVALTLQYAHVKGVVHRDIKPENVILTFEQDEYTPVITDFDLSWFPTATMITQAAMGHAYYAAPEQLHDAEATRSRDPAVDIYSVGQLLYFVLTENDPRPLDSVGNGATLQNRLIQSGLANSSVDRLVDIYSTASNPAARHRFESMQKMSDEISKAIQSVNTPAPGDGSLTFRTFMSLIANRANLTITGQDHNFRITAKSRSQRTSVEVLDLKQSAQGGQVMLQFRFKYIERAGGKHGNRTRVKTNHARVDAMCKSDAEVQSVNIDSGYRIAQLRVDLRSGYTSKDAQVLARRIQKVISAGERII